MRTWDDPQRPDKVNLAIKLLLGVIGIGMIQVGVLVFRHLDVRSPDALLTTKVVIYTGSLILLYLLAKGQNWSRFVLLAILAVAIPLVVIPTLQAFFHFPVYGLLEITQLALYVVALVLLFQKSSSDWFRKGS